MATCNNLSYKTTLLLYASKHVCASSDVYSVVIFTLFISIKVVLLVVVTDNPAAIYATINHPAAILEATLRLLSFTLTDSLSIVL